LPRPPLEVADIFRVHGPAWRRANAGHVSLDQLKVMSAIESCRTAALGGHVARCEKCSHTLIAYNSCRNRHCPKCQGAAARDWLVDREADLLPIGYFHLVFTLPAEIAPIAYQNKAVVYHLLFRTAAETLLTIAADPKHLGARIGATAAPAARPVQNSRFLTREGRRWAAASVGDTLSDLPIIEEGPLPDPQATDDRPDHPELFISYASGDLDRAAALHARLVAEGFRVWFDKFRLTPGCDWHKEIEAGCEAARVILPLITPRWARSEWTRYETYDHDTVIPVLAEGDAGDVMPSPLHRWNAVALDPLAVDDGARRALLTTIRAKLAAPPPERASRIVNLPYPANPFFTGRDDDLVRIHEELHAAPVAALTQGRVRALAAMGGIGKTTLANE